MYYTAISRKILYPIFLCRKLLIILSVYGILVKYVQYSVEGEMMTKINKFLYNSEDYAKKLICFLMTIIMGFLFIDSFLNTMHIVSDDVTFEGVFLHHDNIFLNACYFFIIFVGILVVVPYIEKIPIAYQLSVLSLVTIACGVAWILTAQCELHADSLTIIEAAKRAAKNDFSFFNERYFNDYQYLLGTLGYFEIFARLFQSDHITILYLQIPNLIYFVLSYIGIVITLGKLFKSKRIQSIACLTLLFCIQPIMFSVFVYGIIPGFCFSVYAFLFEVMYFQCETKKRYLWGFLSALSLTLAVVIKSNNYIVLIALLGMALVKFFSRRKISDLVYIVVAAVMALSSMPIIAKSYEIRSGIKLGDSVPMMAWLAMGLDDPGNTAGCTAPGWYSGEHTAVQHMECGYDADKTAEATKEAVKERIGVFMNDYNYANDFFYEKITSQWNEPTYECLWLNWARPKYNQGSNLTYRRIAESGSPYLVEYMNIHQQFVFFAALIGVLLCFKKKDILCSGFILIILGGFLYHLIFEAKSQYILPYFIFMCGFSAVGTDYIYDKLNELLAKHRKNKKAKADAK